MHPARSCAVPVAGFGLALVLAAVCPAAEPLRAPYLQNVGRDRATILWTSSERTTATVRYSEGGDFTRSVTAAVRLLPASPGEARVYQYRADLRGLQAGREYFYDIYSDERAITDDLRFRTSGPGPFRFLVFGDSGTGNENQIALAKRMAESENPSLVLHTGDLSQESGTPEQLDTNYLKVYAQLMGRSPFFATPGNHDYYTDSGAPCFAIHAPPQASVPVPPQDEGRYYSFDWGNVHFVSLNSNLMEYPDAAERMVEWLERDLSTQRNFWKVVYFHHTPYPTGHHTSDPVSRSMRERVVPVLERHGVQVVFAGHEHSYQRTHPLKGGAIAESGGTVYVTTGGGGGVLHYINPGPLHAIGKSVHHYIRAEVRGARMILTVVGVDGQTIDTVTITAPTNPSVEAVLNSGSFTASVAAGSLISIFGRDLATTERAPRTPAIELAGTSVTLNGEPLPLLYVAPHQINAQLPYGFTGMGALRIESATSSQEVALEVQSTAPAILQVPVGFRQFAALWKSGMNTLVTRSTPAQAGEFLTIYLVGLGSVRGAIAAGEASPGSPALRAAHTVTVRIGDRTVAPTFAGLTPGFTGLYQVNVQVPDGVASGAAALRVVAGENASDPVTLFVDSPAK